MVVVFDTTSGKRMPEMEPQSYADEVLMAGWTDVPDLSGELLPEVLPRLAAHELSAPGKPSPLADPDFIARVYRSQG